jgi:hypothetical protein
MRGVVTSDYRRGALASEVPGIEITFARRGRGRVGVIESPLAEGPARGAARGIQLAPKRPLTLSYSTRSMPSATASKTLPLPDPAQC